MTSKKLKKHKAPKKPRSALVFEELEPRLLLSADLPVDLPGALTNDQEEEEPVPVLEASSVFDDAPELTTTNELVFVDTATPDYQRLVDDLLGKRSDQRQFEVVLLDSGTDGVTRITSALSEHSGLDAVHIISHGDDGVLSLGGSRLDFDTLHSNIKNIQKWGRAFSENGDLMIYGCDLAASEDGRALVTALSSLTGADVAASDDLTGHADLGGDWELEYSLGTLSATVPFNIEVQEDWEGLLANNAPTFIDGSIGYWNFDEGSGDSTAESAIGISAGTLGSTAGADTNDPAWTAGKFGQALHFDGANDYVEVVDAPGIDISGPEFSASLWMKPDAGPNKEDMLFMKGDRSGDINYYLSWKDSNEMTWASKEGVNWHYQDMPVTMPTTGQWNHIAITFDRPTVSLYVNGTKYVFNDAATDGTMDRDLTANSEPLWIGAGRSGGTIVGVNQWSGPFTGSIDDLALYDRALTDAEIEAIRTSPPPAATATSFTLDENSADNTVVGSVVATDPDIGDTLSYDITGGNTGGAFAIDANGQISVANSAALDFETNPVFNLTVEATDDGVGPLSDSIAVTVTLSDVNDAPNATNDASSTNEDTAVVIDVLANDSDAEGDTLTARMITGPSNGTLVPNALELINEINLTNDAANDREAAWSPDGTKIAFRSNRDVNDDIWVMDANGSNPIQLTDNNGFNGRPVWSPDGTQILFTSDRSGIDDIWIMNANGSGQTNLTNNALGDDTAATWSPDGSQIAFNSNRGTNDEIYVMNANGTGQVNITNDPAKDSGPSWSPDGTKILFISDRGASTDVWVMDANGSNPVNLTNNPTGTDSNASWSVDGSKIVFKSDRDGGNNEIYVMDANGSNQTRLTDNIFVDGAPNWSPGGSQIIFQTNRVGNHEIYVADISSDGNFTYTPDAGFSGVDSFTYVANDGSADSNAATVTITVNSLPTAEAGGPYSINEGQDLVLDGSGSSDADTDPLTYAWDVDGDGAYDDATGANPTLTWAQLKALDIPVNDDGSYTIGLRVDDGNSGIDTTTVNLTVANTGLTLTAWGNTQVDVGQTYTLSLGATDPGADTITSWTINWGDGSIQTVAGDPASVTHDYNNAGFTNNITVSAVDEDGVFYNSALLVANAASGTDGYLIRYGYDPATGQADWANRQVINTDTASDLDWAGDVIVGPDGYIYATGYQSQNIVRFDATTGAQDLSFEITTAQHFVSIDFGPDGLLYATSDSKWVKSYDVSDPSTVVNTWTLGYTPEEMAFGTDGHLYVGNYVSSGQIYQHDLSDTNWADDAVFASPPDGAGVRTEQFAFGPDGNLYVARIGGDILKYDLSGPSPVGTIFASPGQVGGGWPNGPTGLAFGPDGKLYLTSVDSVLRYDITDAAPATPEVYVPTSGGLDNPWFTTFTPNQQVYVNDSPQPVNDSFAVDEDGVLSDDVSTNDTLGVRGGTYTVEAGDEASNGVVVMNTDGSFTYTPSGDFNGADSFTYTVTDSDGDSATATVSITVNPVNDAPLNTIPPAQNTPEDTALIFSTANGNLISVGDVDAGNSRLQVTLTSTNGAITLSQVDGLSFTAGTGTDDVLMTFTGMIADINAALDGLSFTPDADYNGAADIQIQTSDLGSQIYGNDAIFGSSTTAGDFDKEQIGTQIVISDNGTLTSVTAYLLIDKTEDVRVGLYADVAGEPGGLIVESSAVSQVPGTNWYTIDVPATAVTAGTYWLAMDIGKEGAYFYDAASGQTRLSNYDPNGGLAAPWSGTYASNTQSISVFANVTPDSATPESDTENVSITVNAVNDAATIGGVDAANLTEDTGAIDGYLTATGTLTASDVDNPDNTFTAASHRGSLGDLTIDGSGNWTFTVDNSLPGIQTLAAGSSVNDVITVSSIDGTTHDITITITGNAAPSAVNDAYTVTEDGTLAVDWWDADWSRRSVITFDNSGQGELTDMPVLVVLNGLMGGNIDYTLTQDDGSDLRFFDANGNTLAYDIEEWNESGDSYVWVKVPQITGGSNTDTIKMYWGNASATSAENASAVWSNGYAAVHHLHDDFNDATVQRSTGTNSGSADWNGQVGDGQLFDGVDDFVSLGDDTSLQNIFDGGGTVSAWIYATGWGEGDFGRIFDKSGNTLPTNTGWALELYGAGQNALLFQHGFSGSIGQWHTGSNSISLNAWNHVSLTYDSLGTANVPEIYINGQLQTLNSTQPTGTVGSDVGYDLTVGNHAAATTRTFDGVIDNVQISSTARSADWIKAQHLATSGLFASVGPEEPFGTSAGVLDNDTVPDPHTPSATNLDTTGTIGLVTLNNDGSFTYDTNGKFDYLAAGVDATDTFSYTLDDGVNPPTVATVTITVTGTNDVPVATDDAYSVDEDQTLTINTEITTGIDSWWELNEGGTSQTIADSSGNGNDGTLGDTNATESTDPAWIVSSRTGDPALDFDGGDDYVQTSSTDLQTALNFTLSAWFQTDTTTGQQHLLWQGIDGENGWGDPGGAASTSAEMHLSIGHWSTGDKISFFMGWDEADANSIDIISASDFTDTAGWHLATVVVTDLGGGTLEAKLYVDGQLEGSDTGTQIDRSSWDTGLRIGGGGNASRYFDGRTDDVRVYNHDLSPAEVSSMWHQTGGLLANDLDPEGSMLNAVLVSGPSDGSLSLNADGSFEYTPDNDFFGIDSFTYKASDGTNDSNVVSVTISVDPVNDTPTLAATAADDTLTENTDTTSGAVFTTVTIDPIETGDDIASAQLTIGGGIENSDILTINGTAITGLGSDSSGAIAGGHSYSYVQATGVVTITFAGTTGAAAAELVLESITYGIDPADDDPSTTARTVTLNTVTDNGGGAATNSDISETATISVGVVNDTPTLAATAADDSLTENTDTTSGAVFPTVTIDPIETGDDIALAQLTIGGGIENSDILTINGTAITGLGSDSSGAITGGHSYSYVQATGVVTITFAGTTGAAAAELVLESITYGIDPADNDPSTTARTVTLNTVTDNGGGAATNTDISETATISVGEVNDTPTLAATAADDTLTENTDTTSGAVFTSVTIDPIETGDDMASAQLTIGGGIENSDILTINGTAITGLGSDSSGAIAGGHSYSYVQATGVVTITFAGTTGAAAAELVLESITYGIDPADDDPSTTARTVTLNTVTDNGGGAATNADISETATISVGAVNDTPTLAATAADDTLTENTDTTSGAVFTTVTIDPIETGDDMASAQLTIGGGIENSDILTINGTAITGLGSDSSGAITGGHSYSYVQATGVVTITFAGTTGAAAAELVLESITYGIDPADDDPSTTARTVTLNTVTDNGGGAATNSDISETATISVGVVNDTPTLAATAADDTLTENTDTTSGAVFTTVTIDPIETGDDMASAQLTIGGGIENSDILTINGTAITGLGSDSSGAIAGGHSYSYVQATGVVTITFAGTTGAAAAELVLESITYGIDPADNDPSTTARTVTLNTVTDNGGGAATNTDISETATISVGEVNDTPTLAATAADDTLTENTDTTSGAVFTTVTIDPIETGDDIASAQLTIGGGIENSDILTINGTAITGLGSDSSGAIAGGHSYSYVQATGVVTITFAGTTGAAAAELVLESITYGIDPADNDPSTTARTVTLNTVTDNGGGAATNTDISETATISVGAVDDALNGTATGNTMGFIENGAATAALFSSAGIDTVETGDTITSITFNLSGFIDGADQLFFNGTQVDITGGNAVTAGGFTYTVAADVSTVTVTHVGASDTAVNTLIDNITFDSMSDDPGASRTVNLGDVDDTGTAGVLNPNVDATINITAVNDTPTLAATAADDSLTENTDTTSGAVFPTVTIDPIETGDDIALAQLTIGGGIENSDILTINGTAITGLGSDSSGAITGGHSYSYVQATGVVTITFAGTTGAAAAELVLESITYGIDPADDDPSTTARTVTLNTVTDNGGGAATNSDISETATISVGEVNDTPTLAATAADDTLMENTDTTSGAVFTSVTIDPIELGDDIASAQLTIGGGIENSDILTINGTAITGLGSDSSGAIAGGHSYSYVQATGVVTITFAGTTGAAAAELVLESITYGIDPADNDPSTTARTVTLNTVTDNGGGAATNSDINETATISVGVVNDTPTLAATAADDTLTENTDTTSGAVFTTVTIDPIETGDDIASAQLTIGGGIENSDILTINGTAITGLGSDSSGAIAGGHSYSYVQATGVVTITFAGTTGAAAAELVLESITYGIDPADNDPSTTARTVTLNTVTDNGGGAATNTDISETATISVGEVNDTPTLAATAADDTLTENTDTTSGAVFTSVTIDPIETGDDMASAQLTIGGGIENSDILTINGTAITGLGSDSSGAIAGGHSYSYVQATGVVTITFAGTTGAAAAELVLESITYGIDPADDDPSTTARTVTLNTVTDNGGGAATNADISETATISVGAVNDTPTLAATAADDSLTENTDTTSGAVFTTVTIDPIETGDDMASAQLTIGGGIENSDILTINGTAITGLGSDSSGAITGGHSYSYVQATGVVTITFAGTTGAAAAELVLESITYGIDPADDDPSTTARTVTLNTVTDNGGGAATNSDISETATISVGVVNDTPTLAATAADDTLTENTDTTSGAVFTTVTIDPIETGDDMASAQLTIGGGIENSDILTINGTAITGLGSDSSGAIAGGHSYSYVQATGVVTITFAGTTGAAAAELVLESITYGIDPADNDPSTTARTVTLNTVTDNGGGAATNTDISETATISVGEVNDTPTLAATAADDTLTENTDTTSGAVFTTVTIDPIETGDDIASAQLTIGGGIENSDILTINGTAITGLGSDSSGAIAGGHSYSYVQATGVVTITFAGTTGAAAAELVLESITYGIDPADNDPSTTARTVTLNTVTDNGGGAATNTDISETATISVGAVDDALNGTATGNTMGFIENGAATAALFSSAGIDTVETGDTITSITFNLSGFIDGADQLFFNGTQVDITGGNAVTAGGFTYTVAADVSTVTVTHVGASDTAVNTLIDNITFDSMSDDPGASRTVNLGDVDDTGTAGVLNPNVDATINITAVNDTPTLAATAADDSLTENTDTTSGAVFTTVTIDPIELGDDIASAQLTIGGGIENSDILTINGTAITGLGSDSSGAIAGGHSYSYVQATGVVTITFAGTTGAAAAELVLESITYGIDPADDDPSTTARTVTLNTVTDNGGGAATNSDISETATISVGVVNDTPTLAATAADDSLTENTDTTSGAVFPTVTIDPIEPGDDMASAQLTIGGGIENSDILTINGTAITGLGSDSSGAITGGHSYSYVQATGVVTITFAGTTGAAAAELVLESITYGIDPADDDPSTTARTVTLNTVTDNGGGAATNSDISETATISVGVVNDTPTLAATAADDTLTENTDTTSGAVFTSVTIDPIETGDDMASAQLTIGGGIENSDILTINGTAITGLGSDSSGAIAGGHSYSYVQATGVVTITFAGTTGAAAAELVLESITYGIDPADNDPSTTARTVTLNTVTDNGGGAATNTDISETATISVGEVNDTPTLAATAADDTLTENTDTTSGAVFTTVTIDPIETGDDIASAQLTIGGGIENSDILTINGTAITGLGSDSSGAIAGGHGYSYVQATGVVTITFAGTTGAAAAELVLESITYGIDPADNDPSTTARTVTLNTVTDNGGGAATNTDISETATISVGAVDDALNGTATGNTMGFIENGAATAALFSSAGIDTVETGDTITSITFNLSGFIDGADQLFFNGTQVDITGGNAVTAGGFTYTVAADVSTVTVTHVGASDTAVNTLIDNITFDSMSDDPGASRTVNLGDVDDTGTAGVLNPNVDATINITAVNDTPTLAATAADDTLMENTDTTSGAVFTSVTIDPIELGDDIASAQLTIGGGIENSDILTINGTAITGLGSDSSGAIAGGHSYSYVQATGVVTITFAGTTGAAAAELVLESITYGIDPADDDPSTTARTVTLNTVTDNGGGAATNSDINETATISVGVVNDTPTLAATAADDTLMENTDTTSGAVFTSVTIDPIELGDDIASAQLTIGGGIENSDILTINGTAITGLGSDSSGAIAGGHSYSYVQATGVVTITFAGTTGAAAAELVLESITYGIDPADDDPSTTARTVTLNTVTDNGGGAATNSDINETATISVGVVNDTPTLAATAADDTLMENTDTTSGAVFTSVTIDPIELGDDIASAQLTIGGGIENSDILTINGTAITGLGSDSSGAIAGGHSYSYVQATGMVTITFAGTTGAAAAELVLESITYGIDPADNDPSTTARTVTLNTVTDNGGGAATNTDISETATISVGEVNDTPTLAATAADDTLTENTDTTSGAVFTSVTIDPIETGDDMASAQLTIGGGIENSDILTINGTAITGLGSDSSGAIAGGHSYSYVQATGVVTITFAGTTGAAAAELVLESITYGIDPADNDPSTTARTVTLNTVTDNGGGAATNTDISETATISVGEVNDTPTLAATAADDSLTENTDTTSGAVFTTVTIDPIETGDDIASAQLTIGGGIENSDILTINGTAITGLGSDSSGAIAGGHSYSYVQATGVVTITFAGTTGAAAAELVLESITYGIDPADDDPSTTARTVTLNTVTDNGGGAATNSDISETATISVGVVNDTPTLAATAADDTLTENTDTTSGAVFTTVTIDPIETGDDMASAQLTIGGGIENSDILTINGTAITGLGSDSSGAIAGGHSYSYVQATGVVTITFAGTTGAAAAELVLESITYGIDPADDDPSTTARTVTLNTVTDNGGGAATNSDISETATISVGVVNDTPTLAATAADDSLTENTDTTSGAVFPTVTIDPIEPGDDMASAQLTIGGGIENSDILTINGTAITGLGSDSSGAITGGHSYSYVQATGVVTITFAGTTGAAAAELVLESITYGIDPADDDPSTTARTVTLNTVTDNGGGAATNSDISETATITITGTNDAPVITDGPDTAGLSETDAGLSTGGTLTVGDVDTTDVVIASIDSLAISGTSDRGDPAAPSDAALLAMLTVNPAAILDGTENSDTLNWTFDSGAEAFDYLATGETLILEYMVEATDDDGTPLSDTETVTITVTGTNDPPVIGGDTSGSVTEDITLSASGTLSVTDPDDPDGVQAATALIGDNALGTLDINASGDWTYTLDNTDSSVQALAAGATLSDAVTVTLGDGVTTQDILIAIHGTNDVPIANNDSFTVNEGSTNILNLAINDTDVDDAVDLSGITLVSGPVHGSLTVNADGTVNYAHNGSETVSDNFTYTIKDATGATSNIASVNLTVLPVNDSPINSVPQAQSMAENTTMEFSNLVGNGISVSDPDVSGAAMEITLTVSDGTLTLSGTTGLVFTVGGGSGNSTMTFTGNVADINSALNGLKFKPNSGYHGSATLQLFTDDLGNTGNGGALNAVDTVTISVVQDAPVIPPPDTLPPLDELIDDPLEKIPDPLSSTDSDDEPGKTTVLGSEPQDSIGFGSGIPDLVVSRHSPLDITDFERLPDDNNRSSSGYAWQVATWTLSAQLTGIGGLFPVSWESPLWGSIDSMTSQIDDAWGSEGTIFTTPATYLTFGVTVGYVTWLLKAGYLSASMLSVVPLWREFDPLMVLAKPKDKKKVKGKNKEIPDSNDTDAERLFDASVQTDKATDTCRSLS